MRTASKVVIKTRLVLSAAVLILMCAFPAPDAAARSLEEDVRVYVQAFSGDKQLHSTAADNLAWMGLSDTRVFDIVEQLLLQDYELMRRDKAGRERVARYIHALGFSGEAKYTPTLTRLQTDKDYGRHALTASNDLPLYHKWNPIISNRATFNPKYDDDTNRVLNMLRSDDLLLKRVAAKRVYFGTTEDEVLDLLAEQVRASYLIKDSQFSDPIAWLVKALASAKKEKYLPLLQQVAANAPDEKVRDYARNCVAASGPSCSRWGPFMETPKR